MSVIATMCERFLSIGRSSLATSSAPSFCSAAADPALCITHTRARNADTAMKRIMMVVYDPHSRYIVGREVRESGERSAVDVRVEEPDMPDVPIIGGGICGLGLW